jgi:hypothetical protein
MARPFLETTLQQALDLQALVRQLGHEIRNAIYDL